MPRGGNLAGDGTADRLGTIVFVVVPATARVRKAGRVPARAPLALHRFRGGAGGGAAPPAPGAADPRSPARVFAEIERIKRHFRTLETLGVPVVTCLNGAALGGGWEVALVGLDRRSGDRAEIGDRAGAAGAFGFIPRL